MTQEKIYKYLGRNGNIISTILLENISPIPMFKLTAASGKILTNGNIKNYSVNVFEDEVNDWYEIDDIRQE
jgi:hypothetical protein